MPALREAGFEVSLFFSNANIAPEEEYGRRLAAARRLAELAEVPLVVDPTRHVEWLETVAKGFEDEPEGGARCARCFRFSLARTGRFAEAEGYALFTTSLTVSPHKHSPTLFRVGGEVGGERFLAMDFKKRDGFRRSVELAERYGLYRQRYCGCEFSRRADAGKEVAE